MVEKWPGRENRLLCDSFGLKLGGTRSTGRFWWTNAAWPIGVPWNNRAPKRSKAERQTYEQNDACSRCYCVRRGVLVRVVDFEVADDGVARDCEVACRTAGTNRLASVHAYVHGRRTSYSRGVCCSGAGLLHFCVAAQSRTRSLVDRISGNGDVCTGSGVAANGRGDLHTGGGFSKSVGARDSEMSEQKGE